MLKVGIPSLLQQGKKDMQSSLHDEAFEFFQEQTPEVLDLEKGGQGKYLFGRKVN